MRPCVSVPHKRFLGNYWSHHHQTWHGGRLRHDNASRVNLFDFYFILYKLFFFNVFYNQIFGKCRYIYMLHLKIFFYASTFIWHWPSVKVTYLNHENTKGSIIVETLQAMPINFAVKIARLKVYILIFLGLRNLPFTQGHNCISNLTHILQYIAMAFKLCMLHLLTWLLPTLFPPV